MEKSRRDFFKKSFGVMGTVATTALLAKISLTDAQALEIGKNSNSIDRSKNPIEGTGVCGMAYSCSGGGGQCGMAYSCGGQ